LASRLFVVPSNNKKKSKTNSIAYWQPRWILLGLVVFGNQAGFVLGIKLAGPIAAAVWQPSQPIFTAAIAMLWQWEPWNRYRVLGVAISFLGCALMVLLSTTTKNHQQQDGDEQSGTDITTTSSRTTFQHQELLGHALFFVNCLCTSLYVLLSKKLLQHHPPLLVTAWSYNIAAVFMGVTALLVSCSKATMEWICPDCDGDNVWTIPSGAFFALGYFILFTSVAGYGIMTWANQHATGTLIMGYTVLQPVTAALLTLGLLQSGLYPSCKHTIATTTTTITSSSCLDPPGWGSVLGMVGVFGGLYLVIRTEPPITAAAAVSYQALPQME
jgi:drug/metabolite transporter (DMT)-like permease